MIVQNSAKQRARLDDIEALLDGADDRFPSVTYIVFEAILALSLIHI